MEEMNQASNLDDAALEVLTRPDGEENKAERKAREKRERDENKVVKYFMPFVAMVFTPRQTEPTAKVYTRGPKKGQPTGIISRLVAEITLPFHGNILVSKASVWESTRYDRTAGQFTKAYDLSFGDRFNLFTTDAGKVAFETWKADIIRPGGLYEKWAASPAAQIVIGDNGGSMAPRLVKVEKVRADDPAVLEYERLIRAAGPSATA